ncbi:CAP domain-containing protein [Bacillus spongiae]|uniref:CAP domain-containing protein n=1 Tax=Bacillus spongiae TaxID=2683610 RepID=A0ABU8HBP6_9BACI
MKMNKKFMITITTAFLLTLAPWGMKANGESSTHNKTISKSDTLMITLNEHVSAKVLFHQFIKDLDEKFGITIHFNDLSLNVEESPVPFPFSNKIFVMGKTPTQTTEKPVEAEPTQTAQKLAEEEPTQTAQKPAETEPTQVAQKPAKAEPTQVAQKPAEVEPTQVAQKPAEEEPAQTAQEPAEAEPAQTAQEPAEAEPAQTTQKKAETDPPQTTSTVSAFERQVVDLTNAERAKQGLAPLTLDTKLSSVAKEKSNDMQQNGYFDHNSPKYGSPFEMMKSFGITYYAAAENIAKGQSSPEAVVNAWMNSSGHRANILNPNLTHIGVGHVGGSNIWTQMFIGK